MTEVINVNWIKQITGGDVLYKRDLKTQLESTGIFVVDKYCCGSAQHGTTSNFTSSKDFLPLKKSKL